jgi:hypothetical protein
MNQTRSSDYNKDKLIDELENIMNQYPRVTDYRIIVGNETRSKGTVPEIKDIDE